MICQRRVKAFLGMNSNYQWQLVMVCEKMPNEVDCECCNEIKSVSRVLNNIKDIGHILPSCERELLSIRTEDSNSYRIVWEKSIKYLKIDPNRATIFYGSIIPI